MANNILIHICYNLLILSSFVNQSFSWEYNCNQNTGLCERSNVNGTNSGLKSSQNVCRLTCGKLGPLWPAPTISTELGTSVIYLHPESLDFYLNGRKDPVKLFKDFQKIFVDNCLSECTESKLSNDVDYIPKQNKIQSSGMTIHVTVDDLDIDLKPDTDESYSLNITSSQTITDIVTISIKAKTFFGARHGLETLSQLITSFKFTYDHKESVCAYVIISKAFIKDKPIYKHRGLLLDTARNFLPIESIKKQINGLASSKMNVLHWHATDSQSFPVVYETVPEMSMYGAYNSKLTYSLGEIRDVVDYAKKRGVRVIFELDAPSHAGNGWQWGPEAQLGNLAVCVNKMPWRQYCIQPPCGQLNPANPNVFKVLKKLYKELLDIFPYQEYFHMGGDEVFIPCWNSTDEILSYMQTKDWGRTPEDFLKLWAEYQEKSLHAYDSIVGNQNTPIILWSSQLTEPEHIEKYLSKDRYIIQTWVPSTNDLPSTLLRKGYKLIMSTKNAWYLDHGFWGTTQYYQWRQVYANRIPRDEGVLGGEACMWGEYVDENSIDGRIWPRTAAVAERLWSDPNYDTGVVEPRFYRHRDRLVSKKIAADGLAPRWCFQNEGQCK